MRLTAATLLLAACGPLPDPEPPPLIAGPPEAGAAEGTLDLPVGTPMGGFSSRASYLGGTSRQDARSSPYTTGFVESTGIHTRIGIKVIWLTNGDQDLVITQTDTIYSFDGLVAAITTELEQRTGRDLHGKVIHTTNHSHNSYGPFSQQPHFYLGGDKFNREIFDRFVDEVVEVAMQAHDGLAPAAIGTGWRKDWDPNDRVYRDRRGVNNDLRPWADRDEPNGKDPYLNVIRVDHADGRPMALAYTFGIHGIALGEDNSLISSDASGGISAALQEEFDTPVVVMHMQGSGGDASPAGVDDGMARIESLGELAKGPILGLWSDIETSTDPITLETASRHIWEQRDQIHVSRDGTVDWRYAPAAVGAVGDEKIYDDQGQIISPIDEFNAPYGAAFCGSDAPLIPAGNIGSFTYPYSTCVDVGLASAIIRAVFDIPEEEFPLPLRESYKAGTTASRMGPLPTLTPEGEIVDRDLFTGFFPAEPVFMFGEQWRRRVKAELGYELPLLVGYSQDHEGYFLIAEDWLMGGYEPNIALWGPLQAEHVMEGVLDYGDTILSTNDRREDPDPDGYYAMGPYDDVPLPTTFLPDPSPDAGTRITTPPAYLWTPKFLPLDLDFPAQVPRVQGQVQLAWIGGDPMVDLPRVVLEREQEDGSFAVVTLRSGRELDDRYTDLLTGHTPDPLFPSEAAQTHRWWTAWQAVGHLEDRASLPLGNYRLHVFGATWAGGDTTWPWTTTPYEVVGPTFEVVPADLRVDVEGSGAWVALPAPSTGWRLVDLDGHSTGDNPVNGELTVVVTTASGPQAPIVQAGTREGARTKLPIDAAAAVAITVTDAWGNTGTWTRP